MLTEFEGTIDSTGLRHFRQCTRSYPQRGHTDCGQSEIPFWAVLEPAAAAAVIVELLAGQRKKALQLLEEHAVSLGSKTAT